MKQGDAVTAAAEMHQSRLRRQAGRRNQTAAPAASSAGGASMSPRYLVPAAMPKPAPASRNQPGLFRRAPVAEKNQPDEQKRSGHDIGIGHGRVAEHHTGKSDEKPGPDGGHAPESDCQRAGNRREYAEQQKEKLVIFGEEIGAGGNHLPGVDEFSITRVTGGHETGCVSRSTVPGGDPHRRIIQVIDHRIGADRGEIAVGAPLVAEESAQERQKRELGQREPERRSFGAAVRVRTAGTAAPAIHAATKALPAVSNPADPSMAGTAVMKRVYKNPATVKNSNQLRGRNRRASNPEASSSGS